MLSRELAPPLTNCSTPEVDPALPLAWGLERRKGSPTLTWQADFGVKGIEIWPIQLLPRTRSRPLRRPKPTSTPSMNCWSTWKGWLDYRFSMTQHNNRTLRRIWWGSIIDSGTEARGLKPDHRLIAMNMWRVYCAKHHGTLKFPQRYLFLSFVLLF